MATVKLENVYNPLVFAEGAQEAQIELNRFYTSGVVERSGLLDSMASTGGNIGEIPYFKPLGTEEPNYSSDDPTAKSTPSNITFDKQTYRLASQNKSWSTMDLARDLALANPEDAIVNRIGQYWATNNERRIIQSSLGVLADNIANDNGDMVKAVAAEKVADVSVDTKISGDAVLDAFQTLGDHDYLVTTIAMHSVQYTELRKQNLIDFIPNARGEVNIPTYMGKTVIVDDSLPVKPANGEDAAQYTTILYGASAFIAGEGRVDVPSEIDREPSHGNGGGERILYSRRSDIIHPMGFAFLSGSVAGQSATQAELALAANWKRCYDRKNVSMAFLVTN